MISVFKIVYVSMKNIFPLFLKAPKMFNNITHRHFRLSSLSFRKITEVVPPLGESITEGSISKWMKSVGDKVNVDDVVVVVETDKVTVDIKSTSAGILTKQLANDLVCLSSFNDVLFFIFYVQVVVGKDLYEIDTDGAHVQDIIPTVLPSTLTSPSPSPSPITKEAVQLKSRVPLIKFIGKRNVKSVKVDRPIIQSQKQNVSHKPQTGLNFIELKGGAWYGRPQYTSKEVESILSGGASNIF